MPDVPFQPFDKRREITDDERILSGHVDVGSVVLDSPDGGPKVPGVAFQFRTPDGVKMPWVVFCGDPTTTGITLLPTLVAAATQHALEQAK